MKTLLSGLVVFLSVLFSPFHDWSLPKETHAVTPGLVGDITDDDHVDLQDAIVGLQLLSKVFPAEAIHLSGDVNGDLQVGMEEVVFALQRTADLRNTPPFVTGLEIEGQGNNTAFLCRDVIFVWNEVLPWYDLEDFGDEILDDKAKTSTTEILYEVKVYVNVEEVGIYENLTETRFEYTYEMNLADNNGVPQPSFTIQVWALDNIGNRSPYPAELTVNNPPPPSITGLRYNFDGRSLIINWTASHNPCDHLRYELSINGVLVNLIQPETELAYVYPWNQNVSDNPLVKTGTTTSQKDFYVVDANTNFYELGIKPSMRIGNLDKIEWADIAAVGEIDGLPVAVFPGNPHELKLTHYHIGPDDESVVGHINLFENPGDKEHYQIGGYPDPTITVSAVDVDAYWQKSEVPTEIIAVNRPPAAPSRIFATPMTNSVNFVWPKSLEDDVDAYLYRYRVESEPWTFWAQTTKTGVTITLTTEMRVKYPIDPTISIEVRAKDIYYQLSAAQSASGDAISW